MPFCEHDLWVTSVVNCSGCTYLTTGHKQTEFYINQFIHCICQKLQRKANITTEAHGQMYKEVTLNSTLTLKSSRAALCIDTNTYIYIYIQNYTC